ncbi:hypothetical protein XENORESO_019663 [Xenotaenia resolanae]|uniref:Uncharacterized protein n=1 Tax=Xenotaenia resolanae TaxID=208358 RepID=A0ABV0WRU8_9TELE
MASSPPTCRKAALFTASDSIPLTSKVQISESRFRRRKFTNLKIMKRQQVSSQELTRGTFYSENISEYIFIQSPKRIPALSSYRAFFIQIQNIGVYWVLLTN